LIAHPSSNTNRKFYPAHHLITDYGACCLIAPYLYFVNPESMNLDPTNYTAKHWHSQPRGAYNGQFGGIKLLLDVDSFDFSYTGKESVGFRLVFSDVRDKPMLRQDGYLISPGKKKINII